MPFDQNFIPPPEVGVLRYMGYIHRSANPAMYCSNHCTTYAIKIIIIYMYIGKASNFEKGFDLGHDWCDSEDIYVWTYRIIPSPVDF